MLRTSGALLSACAALFAMGLAACGSPSDGSFGGSGDTTFGASVDEVVTGGHLRGISDTDFATAQANFAETETIDDGLGPVFNDSGCGNCHDLGATGGAGDSIERRFGRFDNGVFNPLANEGGSLRQLKTLGSFTKASGQACNDALEVEPADATVHNVGRITTPLFGLGLVDAMPDSFFQNLARNEPQNVRGTVNMVSIVLPNPADSSQNIGTQRVGRFGWKAGVSTLVQFAADAYMNEMGITTQHCFEGTSVTAFATESAPNGIPVVAGCDDNVPGTDDQVGPCSRGETDIQDDVANFNKFMTFLAPPAPGQQPQTNNRRQPSGQQLFENAGCANCHTDQAFTTPRNPANGVPGNFTFRPYSDFLVHDMGSLGDQIGNAGDSLATTRKMRTAPLWGIRFRDKLLHDGRAADVPTAVRAHDGQAASAASSFNRLSQSQQNTLVQFVESL